MNPAVPAASAGPTVRRIAVLGNPNTGKTTLFNALTGLSQRVANYPGVTVEKKTGRMSPGFELVDLPGAYSLSAWSPDELVAADVLLGGRRGRPEADAALVVVDAANLARNLYLVTQVLETGVPVVVALNMVDSAESAGVTVDAAGLSRALGVPVVPTVAARKKGLPELKAALEAACAQAAPAAPVAWPEEVAAETAALAAQTNASEFLVRRALFDRGGAAEARLVAEGDPNLGEALAAARRRIEAGSGTTLEALEARVRYAYIDRIAAPLVTRRPVGPSSTDRLDRVLTHRLLGTAVFVAVMSLVFFTIFEWAAPFMDLISGGFDALGGAIESLFAGTALEGGILESLLVDGVVAGVGGVLVFLPQIAFLFLFISILEDCGYLARAAFLMDRLLRFCGLSGASFIPLLSSFACAVPGIMATRTIPDRRDRIATILVAPLMSCSARIPVYALLVAAFVPATTVAGFLPLQGLVFGSMYFVGILVAVPVAVLLKKTLLRGPTPPFVMELPPYRVPALRNILMRVYQAGSAFVVKAGTVIFAFSIVIWALGTFPRDEEVLESHEAARAAAAERLEGEALDDEIAAIGAGEGQALLERSALGRMGRFIEPAVEPLGWDWRIGMSVLASFPAREVVVSTLGIIFGLGEGAEEDEAGLTGAMRSATRADGTPLFTLATALSLMVFFALCAQCMATLATIRRETNSWRWPVFAFTYMTAFAWIGAFAVYHLFA